MRSAYRIHPGDRPRLDALKLSSTESEADNLRRLLDRDEDAQRGPAFRSQSQAADAKISAAVAAIMAHNDAPPAGGRRWAIVRRAVVQLTGCFASAVERYFVLHRREINAHNQRHQLGPGSNIWHGRRGLRIKDAIRLGGDGLVAAKPLQL